jgi:aminoglycoside 3-N-acetyltransferase
MAPISPTLLTPHDLTAQLLELGVRSAHTLIVHTRMSALGYVVGGAQSVVEALMAAVPDGTLVMPTFTSQLADPASWEPEVPQAWWSTIRATLPAFDSTTTPSHKMGAVPECFRTFPGVRRSSHPAVSFAAWGYHAKTILEPHPLDDGLGPRSPLGHLYDLDAHVLLLGVGHANNSSLHLAEYLCRHAESRRYKAGAPILVDGQRQWVRYDEVDNDPTDFERIGAAFEAKHTVLKGKVGAASARLFPQKTLVDFAADWMDRHRRSDD